MPEPIQVTECVLTGASLNIGNLTLRKATTPTLLFRFLDRKGDPADVSGLTLLLRAYSDGAPIWPEKAGTPGAAPGEIAVAFTLEETAPFAGGRFYCELDLVALDGTVPYGFTGHLRIEGSKVQGGPIPPTPTLYETVEHARATYITLSQVEAITADAQTAASAAAADASSAQEARAAAETAQGAAEDAEQGATAAQQAAAASEGAAAASAAAAADQAAAASSSATNADASRVASEAARDAAQASAQGAATSAALAAVEASSAEAARAAIETGDATIVTEGSTRARSYRTRASDVIWAADYVAADGTDETAGLTAAISKALQTGRELRLPEGTCRADSVITLPNDGATPPTQRPLRIVGVGAHMSGRGTPINGGSVLDLRGAGPYGKIVTSGLGLLEISGVTFTDSSGGSTPFLYTTNTTLHVHDSAFVGTKNGTTCDQDAIVLGGNEEIEGQGGLTHGFQGYGTVIRDNYFNKIRRAVYGRTFANAVVVRDNTIWSGSGSNLAGGAAIEFDNVAAGASQHDAGNVITGNLIEMAGYPYGVKIGRGAGNTIAYNNMYDPSAVALAAVRLESSAVYNTVIDGFVTSGLPAVSDASGRNQHFAVDQGVQSEIGTGGTIVLRASDVRVENGLLALKKTASGDEVWLRMSGVAGTPGILFVDKPGGGAEENLALLKRYGAGQVGLLLYGATAAQVEAPDGDLKLKPKIGSYVAPTQPIQMPGGPRIHSGSGSPEGVVTAPMGSLYMNYAGGAGTTLYVKESGTGNTGWIGMKTAP